MTTLTRREAIALYSKSTESSISKIRKALSKEIDANIYHALIGNKKKELFSVIQDLLTGEIQEANLTLNGQVISSKYGQLAELMHDVNVELSLADTGENIVHRMVGGASTRTHLRATYSKTFEQWIDELVDQMAEDKNSDLYKKIKNLTGEKRSDAIKQCKEELKKIKRIKINGRLESRLNILKVLQQPLLLVKLIIIFKFQKILIN